MNKISNYAKNLLIESDMFWDSIQSLVETKNHGENDLVRKMTILHAVVDGAVSADAEHKLDIEIAKLTNAERDFYAESASLVGLTLRQWIARKDQI